MMVIIAHIVNILKTIELYIFFFLSNYLFLAVLGLHCCEASSSCGEWGLLFSCSAWLSHCSGFSLQSTSSRRTGFSGCGGQAVEHRLSSCGTQA